MSFISTFLSFLVGYLWASLKLYNFIKERLEDNTIKFVDIKNETLGHCENCGVAINLDYINNQKCPVCKNKINDFR